MRQNIVHDPATAEYAGGLDNVWANWEPALRDMERILLGGAARYAAGGDELAEILRRAQYKAHTAGEFIAGMHPPLPAADAHEMLLTSFSHCRDTLGVLALRAELDELDEHTAEIGLGSISATRDAFRSARQSTTAAWRFRESIEPVYFQEMARPDRAARVLNIVMWSLIGVCALLFTVLLFEVFLLTPLG
jgi:hypothetical protein